MVGSVVASKGALPLLVPNELLLIVSAILFTSSGNIMNDICDREQDKKKRFKPLASGHVSLRDAKMLYTIVVGLAIAIAYTINFLCFILAVSGCLLGALYSVRPVRLKEKYMLSYVTLAFCGTIMLPFYGYAATKHVLDIIVIAPISFVLFAFMTFSFIGKDIIDYRNDYEAGVETLPIRLGKKCARRMLSAGLLLSPLLVPLFILMELLPMNCMLVFLSYPAILYVVYSWLSGRYEKLLTLPFTPARGFQFEAQTQFAFVLCQIFLILGYII